MEDDTKWLVDRWLAEYRQAGWDLGGNMREIGRLAPVIMPGQEPTFITIYDAPDVCGARLRFQLGNTGQVFDLHAGEAFRLEAVIADWRAGEFGDGR